MSGIKPMRPVPRGGPAPFEVTAPEHSFILDKHGDTIGHVTSAAWCPTAKTNIALASMNMPWGRDDDEMYAEIYYNRELHWTRLLSRCRPRTEPVFNPPRRRATPAGNL